MNILMITEKDAANTSLAYIAEAFLRRGDEVIIYAPYYDTHVLSFFNTSIQKRPIKNLTAKEIDWCDVIFCSTLSCIYMPIIVFTAKKPIFTHNYLMNRQINWGGDICFAPTQATVASDYDEYMNYSYIGIGEPKYDHQEKPDCRHKRFLFIDSGHYPFSLEGKKELARTLIDICRKYPDYELWIKPRVLPDDKIITHRNDIHIYDVIRNEVDNDIPENMVMLDHHEDLMKLINQSLTVICMYTTAFVGAVAAGKGLIVLENLKTTDIYDIRHKTYMRNRENIVSSGALIDYRNVGQLLPYGVKATEEYLHFLLEEKEHVADKICGVCEYLWEEYYSKNRFPKKCDSTYKHYKNDFVLEEGMTWERKITQRCHDYILLKSLILIDFHIKAKLDISYVLERAEDSVDENGIIQEDTFRRFLGGVNNIRDNCIIRNREILLRDNIDAGVLLNAYYLQGKFEEIRKFPLTDIATYNMYRAYVAIEDINENDDNLAKEHLIKYFSKCMDRQYNLEVSDMPNSKFKAFEELIKILRRQNDVKGVRYYYKALLDFYLRFYMVTGIDVEPSYPQQKKRYGFICETKDWINGEIIKDIKYIFLDVDGTLTDGSIYYSNDGQEMKQFHIKDGLAIVQAQKAGIKFVVITGRKSSIVERRMKELNVEYVFQGIEDKKRFLRQFLCTKAIEPKETAYIGDDLNDLPAMCLCEFKACPQDACEELRQIADYVSELNGGCGAVRDIIEYIFKRQNIWKRIVSNFSEGTLFPGGKKCLT